MNEVSGVPQVQESCFDALSVRASSLVQTPTHVSFIAVSDTSCHAIAPAAAAAVPVYVPQGVGIGQSLLFTKQL